MIKICKFTNCKNPTTARNGICVDCFRTSKHLKKFLMSKEGFEQVQEILYNHGFMIVQVNEMRVMKDQIDEWLIQLSKFQ